MSTDVISRNSLGATAATTQRQDAYAVKRAELQANQADEIAKRRQAEQTVPQPVVNAQGQPTGTLINLIA